MVWKITKKYSTAHTTPPTATYRPTARPTGPSEGIVTRMKKKMQEFGSSKGSQKIDTILGWADSLRSKIGESASIPFVDPILNLAKGTWNAAQILYRLARTRTPEQAISHRDKKRLRKELMDSCLDAVEGLSDLINEISERTGFDIPFMGAIVSTATNTIKLGKNCREFHRQRMILEDRAMQRAIFAGKSTPGDQKLFNGSIYTQGVEGRVRDGATGNRRMRTDEYVIAETAKAKQEVTLQQGIIDDSAASREKKDEAKTKLDEAKAILYDMSKRREADLLAELDHMNANRGERLGFDITQNVTGIMGALISLEPTIGSLANKALTRTNALIKDGKSVAPVVQQAVRGKGWFNTDRNKSDKNKAIRRHNLAIVMYDNIKGLNRFNLDAETASAYRTTDESLQLRRKMERVRVVDERLGSMDLSDKEMLRAPTANAAVELIRQGFYRNGGG